MTRLIMLLLALPLTALAAEPAAQQAPAPTASVAGGVIASGVGGQVLQLLLGLLLVIGLIFGLAWLMRRVQSAGPGGAQAIQVVSTRAIGPRDRLVLVQVGKEQILLGVTPGQITSLHVLAEPIEVAGTQAAPPEFARRLLELMGKDQKERK